MRVESRSVQSGRARGSFSPTDKDRNFEPPSNLVITHVPNDFPLLHLIAYDAIQHMETDRGEGEIERGREIQRELQGLVSSKGGWPRVYGVTLYYAHFWCRLLKHYIVNKKCIFVDIK